MRSEQKKLKGFTLVELLVVISIMALLLSILVPALGKARDQAKRALCSSNLHQWGLVMQMYTADNREKLLDTPDLWGNNYRYANSVWINKTKNPVSGTDGFSVEAIGPYTPGYDAVRNEIGGIWQCPSNTVSVAQMMEDQKGSGYTHTLYAYYGRVENWDPKSVTHPEGVTGKRLMESKVLMNDTLYRWQWFDGLWMYNHGQYGPSAHIDEWGEYIDEGPPATQGINQLYGDGHVEWRDGLDPYNMERLDRSQPRVMGDPGGDSCFFAYDGLPRKDLRW